MKTLSLFLIALFLLGSLMSCATSQVSQCPSDNIVFVTIGGKIIHVPKGAFNQKGKGLNWITEEEYQKAIKEIYEK